MPLRSRISARGGWTMGGRWEGTPTTTAWPTSPHPSASRKHPELKRPVLSLTATPIKSVQTSTFSLRLSLAQRLQFHAYEYVANGVNKELMNNEGIMYTYRNIWLLHDAFIYFLNSGWSFPRLEVRRFWEMHQRRNFRLTKPVLVINLLRLWLDCLFLLHLWDAF